MVIVVKKGALVTSAPVGLDRSPEDLRWVAFHQQFGVRLNLKLAVVVLHKDATVAKVRHAIFNRLASKHATLAAIIIIEGEPHRDLACPASFVLRGFFYVSDLDF